MTSLAGQAFFQGRMNLRAYIERSSRDMAKYKYPVAGRNLYERDEFNFGIDRHLPEHYKRYYREWQKAPSQARAFQFKEGIFEKDPSGMMRRIQNHGGTVLYPVEFHEGLWGGEGVIKAVQAPAKTKMWPNYDQTFPRYWFPRLHESVIYSEVLNRHIVMPATDYGEYLIDKHGGFDAYVLESPVNEVYAGVLLRLKREILLALVRRELHPQNEAKKANLLAKYERFIIPEEEAEWHGLNLRHARERQGEINRLASLAQKVPKKAEYRQELVKMLKEGYLDDVDPDILVEADEGGTVASAIKSISSRIAKTFK